MRRGRQEFEQYEPSSARAVAWGAMFFAFLAFLMSGAALLMTFRGGELIEKIKASSRVIQNDVKQIEQARADQKEDKAGKEFSQQWDRLREKLDRVQAMAREGDSRAKFYLEGVSADLERLRKVSSSQTAVWLGELMNSLKSIRDQVTKNAPEAARRLQGVMEDLKKKMPAPRAATPPGAGPEPSASDESRQPGASPKKIRSQPTKTSTQSSEQTSGEIPPEETPEAIRP